MDLQQLAIIILSAIGGVVPFTQWLKGLLGWQGWRALLLSAVVSVAGAVLTLWAEARLLPGTVSWTNSLEAFITVFLAAQAFYLASVKS